MNVVLVVTGSSAAAHSVSLVQMLVGVGGATVHVILSRAAEDFVTVGALVSAGAVRVATGSSEAVPGGSLHDEWAQLADVVLIAPASMATCARLSAGIGDSLGVLVALTTRAPVVVCPVIHAITAEKPVCERVMTRLAADGYHLVEAGLRGVGGLPGFAEIWRKLVEALEESA